MDALVQQAFEQAFPGEDFSFVRVLPATDPKFGDFQCNDALKLAKKLKLPPRAIAEKVAALLPLKVEVAGPGFLNITVTGDWLEGRLSEMCVTRTSAWSSAAKGARS